VVIKLLQSEILNQQPSETSKVSQSELGNEQIQNDDSAHRWILVNQTRKSRRTEPRQDKQFPKITNCYALLSNIKDWESDNVVYHGDYQNTKNLKKVVINHATTKCKVTLLGNSHMRGLSDRLSSLLGNSFDVTGIVKPNADLEVITSTALPDIKKLTKKDVVVLCGGALNIAKNDSKKGLRYLTHFVRRNSNINVIITNAPFRFYLGSFSRVNTEVRVFKRRLQILMNTSNHVQIFNMSTNRDHYTKHGLHMNNFGKNWTSNNFSHCY
jgi:hypothetical protein